jgi:hypothetical protein
VKYIVYSFIPASCHLPNFAWWIDPALKTRFYSVKVYFIDNIDYAIEDKNYRVESS